MKNILLFFLFQYSFGQLHHSTISGQSKYNFKIKGLLSKDS
ncbi:MAG: hypothetical protein ABGW83_07040 [Flavobacteriaceae bacterium]